MMICVNDKINPYVKLMGLYFILLILGSVNVDLFGSILKLIALFPFLYWLLSRHAIKISGFVFAISVYLFYCCMTCLWSIDYDQSVQRTFTQFSFLCLLIPIFGYSYSQREINFLRKCLVYSSRLSACTLLLFGTTSEGRLFLDGIISEDPNYICAYFLFGISNAIINILNNKSTRLKNTIEISVYLLLILLSGSRGGFIAVIACILTIISFNRFDLRSNFVEDIIKRFSLLIFSVSIISFYIGYLPSEIAGRFSFSDVIDSGGTGRLFIWKSSIYMFSISDIFHQLFGYGTASIITLTYIFPFPAHKVCHNIFIENLVELGIFGLTFYIIHILSFVYQSIRARDLFSMSVLMGCITLSLTTSLFAFKPYWNIMIFIAFLSNCRK